MIYTVTFNPSLDYIVSVNDFSAWTYEPDGFGIDPSRRKGNQCIDKF